MALMSNPPSATFSTWRSSALVSSLPATMTTKYKNRIDTYGCVQMISLVQTERETLLLLF
jgi:hypothetical protein